MDFRLWISVSVTYTWIFGAVLCAPPEAPQRHARAKRCSCATFLDKECVYFCHLDIIWVNTPERVVSYGLGNAPRARRAAPGLVGSGPGPRCRCAREDDSGCAGFCLRHEPRLESASDDSSEQREDTGGTPRNEVNKPVVKPRTLLLKWAARWRRRARAWPSVGVAS